MNNTLNNGVTQNIYKLVNLLSTLSSQEIVTLGTIKHYLPWVGDCQSTMNILVSVTLADILKSTKLASYSKVIQTK